MKTFILISAIILVPLTAYYWPKQAIEEVQWDDVSMPTQNTIFAKKGDNVYEIFESKERLTKAHTKLTTLPASAAKEVIDAYRISGPIYNVKATNLKVTQNDMRNSEFSILLEVPDTQLFSDNKLFIIKKADKIGLMRSEKHYSDYSDDPSRRHKNFKILLEPVYSEITVQKINYLLLCSAKKEDFWEYYQYRSHNLYKMGNLRFEHHAIGIDSIIQFYAKWQGKWGIITYGSNVIKEPTWDEVKAEHALWKDTSNQRFANKVRIADKWGLVGINGTTMIPCIWDAVDTSWNRYTANYQIAIVQRGDHYGIVTIKGETIAEPIWDEIKIGASPYAALRKGNKWGFIKLNIK